jgi:hypothetical protein
MKITQELETAKEKYDGTIEIVDGLHFSQKKQVKTTEYYSNSKYLNGQKDELGREKPFNQILNAICDVENSAKDIDTSDISIMSDDGNHYMESFLLTKDVQVWMKEADFGKTLNDMRDTHTKYGALLVKKCIEKDEESGEKELKIEIPEWKNLITDQVNILGGAIIETHYLTAMDIAKKTEWKNVDKVLEKLKGSNSGKRIPVHEIRGEFTKATFKDANGEKFEDKDEKEFSYQLYYIAGNPVDSGEQKDTLETYTVLYQEDNTERVYKYLARKKKSGRAFGTGVFEEGEEAQVWTNDATLKQHRAMEYTTKVIGQSASKKLKGRNLLNETDDGTILEHEDNKPITALNLLPSGGLQQYGMLINQWYSQLEKTTSAYSAQRGDTPNSGTPFRLQATVLQQSSSVFKDLQEELGIFITEIFEDWVIPFLSKKLTTEHILAYDFSPEELKEIDKNFSANYANKKAIEAILSGKIVDAEQYDMFTKEADTFIKQTKGKRFITVPKDYYKDVEAKVTINVTGEQKNKAATLETLNSLLITMASNPNLTQDPVMIQILNKIIEVSGSGISPISIAGAINEKQGMMEQAQQAPTQQAQPDKMSLQANPAQ